MYMSKYSKGKILLSAQERYHIDHIGNVAEMRVTRKW